MSHVDFKKWPCRPVEFRGQGPSYYTDHAGPEISVHLSIASPFSRQIAIGNAGPILTLDSMGPKPTFRCHFLNIALIYKQ